MRALNEDERPRVRMLGSIGQGDLAPMADLAAGLFEDFELLAKEGIALINSNAFSTGLASLAVADAERLVDTLDVTGATRPRGVRGEPDDAPSGHRRACGRIRGSASRSSGCAASSRGATSGSRAPRETSRIRSRSAASRRSTAPRATRSSSRSDSWRSSSTPRRRTRWSFPTRIASSRSRTSTSSRSPPRWTSSASHSHQRSRARASGCSSSCRGR